MNLEAEPAPQRRTPRRLRNVIGRVLSRLRDVIGRVLSRLRGRFRERVSSSGDPVARDARAKGPG